MNIRIQALSRLLRSSLPESKWASRPPESPVLRLHQLAYSRAAFESPLPSHGATEEPVLPTHRTSPNSLRLVAPRIIDTEREPYPRPFLALSHTN